MVVKARSSSLGGHKLQISDSSLDSNVSCAFVSLSVHVVELVMYHRDSHSKSNFINLVKIY